MNVSKFFGITNREAMRQVRLALGSEALIISNKRVNGGVEIMAADITEFEAAKQSLTKSALPNKLFAKKNNINQKLVKNPQNTDQITEVHGLIDELKISLESRFEDLLWANKLGQSHLAVNLFQHLLACGFSTSLLKVLIKILPKLESQRATINWARAELIKNLLVLQDEKDLWQAGNVIALVGPTGVGKTTTVAKIAARFVQRYGTSKLVLITTDTYRIGAYEQLKIYAGLLKLPLYAVKDQTELQTLINKLTKDKIVLIDNVGISQRDSHISAQAGLLASIGHHVKRMLVLNAASNGDTLDEVAKSYSNDGGPKLMGCIISKTDESTRLGAVLDIAIRYGLQIQFVSNGQKVPENLLLANAKDLVDKALYIKNHNNNLYNPSQADLSALLSTVAPAQDDLVKKQIRRQKVLLPSLLSANHDKQAFDLDALQSGVKQIQDDFLLADTYDLWLAKQADQDLSITDFINHNRSKISGLGAGLKIVIHNRQTLAWPNKSGLWLSTVCFTANGVALSALSQQAGFTDRWLSQNGAMVFKPATQDMVFNQINNENYLLQAKSLHLLDGASQTLLARLHASQMQFVSAIGSRAKLYADGESYLVSALANQLELQMIARSDLAFITRLGHVNLNDLSIWAGSKSVQIKAKAKTYELRLFYVQAINNRTNKPLRAWYGLGQTDLPLSMIARSIILRQEYQSIMRHMISHINQNSDLLANVFYASQIGLSAWHLLQNPVLNKANRVAAGVLAKKQLDLSNAYTALVKLFTLKELLI